MKETCLLRAGTVPGVRMMKRMGFSSALEELVVLWLTDVQTLSMYWGWAKTVKPHVQGEKLSCQGSRGNFLKNTPERNLERQQALIRGSGSKCGVWGAAGNGGRGGWPGPFMRGICTPWLSGLPLRIIVTIIREYSVKRKAITLGQGRAWEQRSAWRFRRRGRPCSTLEVFHRIIDY